MGRSPHLRSSCKWSKNETVNNTPGWSLFCGIGHNLDVFLDFSGFVAVEVQGKYPPSYTRWLCQMEVQLCQVG